MRFQIFILTLTAMVLCRPAWGEEAAPVPAFDLAKDVRPVMEKFCVDCHNPTKHKGDVDLEPLLKAANFDANQEIWEKAAELIESGEMPPEKKPQPTDDQREMLTGFIDHGLTQSELATGPNPGKVTIRRLNKEEYRRTIHDLLKVDFDPKDFPTDEVGYGFNNIGDVLSLSPMLLEKYLGAAEEISRKAIVAEIPKAKKQRIRGDRFTSENEWVRALDDRSLGLYREGEGRTDVDFIRDGEYVLRVRAFGEQAGPEAPKMQVKVEGREIGTIEVGNRNPKTFELRTTVKAGRQPVAIGFLNNYNDSTNRDSKLRGDRNLFVESVEIEGPLDGKPAPAVTTINVRQWKTPGGSQVVDGKSLLFSSEGEAQTQVKIPANDEYIIRVRANADQAGNEPAKLRVRLGDRELGVFEIKARRDGEDMREVRTTIKAGEQTLGIAFVNDFYDGARGADRNLWVQSVEMIGPINAADPNLPESHRRLITRMPEPGREVEVARELLRPFARRAYRRPATDAEVEQLVKFVELSLQNGGSFLEGMQTAVQAALCSPNFLFRTELDPEAMDPGGIRELNDHEIASRLSYFLWSSMPDEELFALADKGELLKDGNLEKQIGRMLSDPRARALVENFGGQWLQVHNLYDVDPDPVKFPNFSDELREDMKRETFAFIEAILQENRSVYELIDADFTFLNERLAKNYGIPGVQGAEFQRVALPKDSPRGGVLAQGSVLLATSMPTRTSPVIRGKWILEQILGTPPPPPPANVPPLDGNNQVDASAPLRKRLEQHRANPDCAGCHSRMDPLGFALENFDALGGWRTMDGSNPIDASAELPNGTKFNGPVELKKTLKTEKFVRAFVEKLMTYALGRGLERYDRRAVDEVVKKTRPDQFRIGAVVRAIVESDPFLKRKAGPRLAGS
ncbi:MAG: DUF1592 domain-containing protein [Chthoniobacteraceae bacterium]